MRSRGSMQKLRKWMRTRDRHSDFNIPISSSSHYPFFHTVLFLGHQLPPPALLALPLDFNRTPGSSRAGSRSQTVMWVVTCFHAYIITGLHRCMETRLWNQARLLGSNANEGCSSVCCFIYLLCKGLKYNTIQYNTGAVQSLLSSDDH